jgi:hypothetical protein
MLPFAPFGIALTPIVWRIARSFRVDTQVLWLRHQQHPKCLVGSPSNDGTLSLDHHLPSLLPENGFRHDPSHSKYRHPSPQASDRTRLRCLQNKEEQVR